VAAGEVDCGDPQLHLHREKQEKRNRNIGVRVTGGLGCVRRGHADAFCPGRPKPGPNLMDKWVSPAQNTDKKQNGSLYWVGLFCPKDTNGPRLSIWVGSLEMSLLCELKSGQPIVQELDDLCLSSNPKTTVYYFWNFLFRTILFLKIVL
jgi:hypothetical protein